MEYNDYELVSLAQENNEDANYILHLKYKNLIYKKSKKVFIYLKDKGLDICDVMQEATLGFDEAIMGYNQDDNTLFFTFASLCIDRQLKSLVIRHSRYKHKILNDAITLGFDEFDYDNLFSNESTPESLMFGSEEFGDLYASVKESLTDFEECVFELKIYGFSYKEIADILDVRSKDVYNSVDRIKNKINKVVNK